jgi:hypothetical protein
MKKNIGIGLIIFVVAAISGFFVFSQRVAPVSVEIPLHQTTQSALPTVSLVIFNGITTATYSAQAKTAYDALVSVTTQEKIPLVSKKYDFGVFVSSIGGKASGTDLAWIYYVNGKSATVGADVYELKSGDRVEWKYTKPLF